MKFENRSPINKMKMKLLSQLPQKSEVMLQRKFDFVVFSRTEEKLASLSLVI